MSVFVKEETQYFVARVHSESNQDEVLRYNEYNGTYIPTTHFDDGTPFEDLAKAQKLRDMMNMMAEFNSAPYTHYVLKRVSTVTEENE